MKNNVKRMRTKDWENFFTKDTFGDKPPTEMYKELLKLNKQPN
jgi:hypothetical protein